MSKRIEVDHTPGGSPETKAAKAPYRAVVNVRSEMLDRVQYSGERIEAKDVLSMARAAAGQGMRNADKYDAETRSDAAADAVARIWRKSGHAAGHCRRGCGATAKYHVTLWTGDGCETATVPLCLAHAAPHEDRRPMMARQDAVPVEDATYTHCLNLVANYRRSLDAQRLRDATEAATHALDDFDVSPELEAVEGGVREDIIGTPYGARVRAVEMMRAAGVLGAHVEHGPLWTLLYSTARSAAPDRATGEPVAPDTVAQELELTRSAVRQHCKRAADRLAAQGHSVGDWLDALHVQTANPFQRKNAAAPLPVSANGDTPADDWRTHYAQRTANVTSTAREAAPILPVAGPTLPPSDAPADWTRYLNATSSARLRRTAEIRDMRSRARTDFERSIIRAAAGLD